MIFENALAGLYHRGAVDLAREQITAALQAFGELGGGAVSYDIADEGLVVWPSDFAEEIVYPLLGVSASLTGKRRGGGAGTAPDLERSALFFATQPILWTDWVEAWTRAPKRMVKGASLLPSAARAAVT